MRRRYILAPEAALDLVQIWRYIESNASLEMADRVESVIREKMVYLAGNSGAGHWRKDLAREKDWLARERQRAIHELILGN